MPEQILRSPIAAAPIVTSDRPDPGIKLRELRPAGLALVAAWPETLDRVEQVLAGQEQVLSLAPGRFLVVGADTDPVPALRDSFDVATAAVTDIGQARSLFRVSGAPAADLLLKGLAIDLDAAAFPPGTTAQSAIHGIGVILHRRDGETFELYCFRGFALSLWEWLLDAGLEYGVVVEPSAF